MPAPLLGLDVSSIAAASTASWGAVLGSFFWRRLSTSQRWAATFLGSASACSIAGDIVRRLGFSNAWVGNLWQLAIPGLLMPALISAMGAHQHSIYRAVQRVAVLSWIIYFLVLGHLGEFTTFFHASTCVATVLLSLTLLFEECFKPQDLRKSPAFMLGVGAGLACAFDVVPHSSFIFWALHGKPEFVVMWVIRNIAWAAGYAVIAYSLYFEVPRE
jgi:hypothetical protein